MKRIYPITTAVAATFLGIISCVDTSQLESDLSGLEERVAAIEETVSKVNDNVIAAYTLYESGLVVMAVHSFDNGTVYRLDMSDGSSVDLHLATEDGKGATPVIGIDTEGNWTVALGEDAEPEVIPGMPSEGPTPQLRVSGEGNWQISTDGGSSWGNLTDKNGNPFPATGSSLTDSFFTDVVYDNEDRTLDITMSDGRALSLNVYSDIITMEVEGYEDGRTILLNESLYFYAKFSSDVAAAYTECPDDWRVRITEAEDGRQEIIVTAPADGMEGDYDVAVYLQSEEKYLRTYTFTFHLNPVDIDKADSEAWNRFLAQSEDNVLLDFSYAGYMHGEAAPPDVMVYEAADGTCTTNMAGYTVYNIKDYQTDGRTDREAFLALLTDALGEYSIPGITPETNGDRTQITFPHSNQPRNIIIYFPEGDYTLHTTEDNIPDGSFPEGALSQSIIIRGSNIIMKGAGKDRTRLIMQDPNLPRNDNMYSSLDMIQFKHNTGVQTNQVLATVTGNSSKGAFSVTVDGTAGLKAGDWVCLYMAPNNDVEVVAAELYPYTDNDDQYWNKWDIVTEGVNIEDLHQIESVTGNTVTFHEPLMHDVDAGWGWTIVRYQHYENVGIEDLTFVGNAKERFDHHAGWEDDGAYKPVSMTRLTNSWIRRVGFKSISEACSIISSANVSAYDIVIDGTRGHSAIRSERSSRVFIGAVDDLAEGYRMDEEGHEVVGSIMEWTGQYHAVGVSKQSMGTVLWRNVWGPDSCFEAHATQPRATLIDCCSGGWKRWRQGGDATQMPNHLADLTIWNFENTTPYSGTWIWWDNNDQWWKFLPPVIVGFHGGGVNFDTGQIKYIESNGTAVTPESLYEAQLRRRLGYVPAWLTALK